MWTHVVIAIEGPPSAAYADAAGVAAEGAVAALRGQAEARMIVQWIGPDGRLRFESLGPSPHGPIMDNSVIV